MPSGCRFPHLHVLAAERCDLTPLSDLRLAQFVLDLTTPLIGELPDPWCRVLRAKMVEKECLNCAGTIIEFQAAYRMLAGVNKGTIARHYQRDCPSCGSNSSGNYNTTWLV